jgi:CHAD domain-containing protein
MIRSVEICQDDRPGDAVLGAFLLFSLKAQWRDYRQKFKRCQKESSEEAVHDLRIAIRRLLSMLSLLAEIVRKKHLHSARRNLKKLLKKFGNLRDTQTQLLHVDALRRDFVEASTYFHALQDRECWIRKQLRRTLPHHDVEGLADAISAIKKRLRFLIQEDEKGKVFESALAELQSAYADTAQGYREIRPADMRSLHRTRVAFKRFRYMMETLHPILRDLTEDRLKSMHEYQARLGVVQDWEVLLACVDKFMKKRELSGQGWKRFRRKLERQRAALVGRFMVSAAELFEFDPTKYLHGHS